MSRVFPFRFHAIAVLIAAYAVLLCLGLDNIQGQDLLGDNITFSGGTLHLRPYVDPGANNRIISMTTQPGNSSNTDLFVTTQEGTVYAIHDNGGGSVSSSVWFNYNTAVSAAVTNANNGFVLDSVTNAHGGLRALAFHPDFVNNGKFYTSAMVDRPTGVSGLNYLGNSTSGFDAESVVAEWTFDHITQQVVSASYRELFRVAMPVFDHPVKQLAFNNFAVPGDEDYGLLYIAHGDGSVQSAIAGGGQNTDDALGKILRVNPLQSGGDPYTTPGNPYVGVAGTLDEIYTLGHRNPHHISFAEDGLGGSHSLVAEAGRDNVEEVNLLQVGGDYGWSDREGTFVHNHNGGPLGSGYGLDYGVSNLPANEWQLNDYVYPAAQYDHNTSLGWGFVGSAIAGGFVIDNGSDPAIQNEYIFADFGSKSGHVYHANFNDLLAAHTQLADGEAPSALTQATISRLHLALDHDNNDLTSEILYDDLNSMLNDSRNDIRFGRGFRGEMYISSKRNGLVYLVTNSVGLPGDLDKDRDADAADFLTWQRSFGSRYGSVQLADWEENFGTVAPLASSSVKVPEPSALVALLPGMVLMLARRWRESNSIFQGYQHPVPAGFRK
ncbi:MAG: PQQ-dependent sugar dehydrogenase [Planctomycetales bacterium]|nr:PQQ-dependent sugar dehydrogenase [Planctomycetales bacterium]